MTMGSRSSVLRAAPVSLRASLIHWLTALSTGAAGAMIALSILRVQPDSVYSVQWTAFVIFLIPRPARRGWSRRPSAAGPRGSRAARAVTAPPAKGSPAASAARGPAGRPERSGAGPEPSAQAPTAARPAM
ncbi:hypothetical protein GCM10010254_28210 [Streptomyces chromofuscus]|nr:hypothetical protein GCM10010254_28210 [Streptomyces chromofuscus]